MMQTLYFDRWSTVWRAELVKLSSVTLIWNDAGTGQVRKFYDAIFR